MSNTPTPLPSAPPARRRDRWIAGEPRLEEMLRDPVVRAVMARDGLNDARLRAALAAGRAALRRRADNRAA